MADKFEDAHKNQRVGILRKRETPGSSSASSTTKTDSIARLKSNTTATKLPVKTSNHGGRSMFAKRTKLFRDKPGTAPIMTNIPKITVSACHSTTTLDSRITATSQTSLSHKLGYIPPYLRNKNENSKQLIAVQVQCNKKKFNQIKKELLDLQNKAVDYYERYRESLVKLNKLNCKDEAPVICDLKIVNFTEHTTNPPPSVVESTPLEDNKISLNETKLVNNGAVFEKIAQHVAGMQGENSKFLQDVSTRLSEISNQMKSAENAEGGDTNLYTAKIQTLFEEIEKKIVEEDQQSSQINTFISNLKQAITNDDGSSGVENGDSDECAVTKQANDVQITELESKIKELESMKTKEEQKNAELTKKIANEKLNVTELKRQLTQFEAKWDEKERDLERLVQKNKHLDSNNKRNEKLIEFKNNEIVLKEKSISDLNANLKSIQDKLTKMSNQNQKAEGKVLRAEEEYKSQLNELRSKYENEIKICDELRKQLNEIRSKVSDDTKPLRDEIERLKYNEMELQKDNFSLKLNLTEMKHSKTLSEKGKIEEQVFRREMDRMENELKRMKASVYELNEDVHDREAQLAKKNVDINELENMVKQLKQRLNESKIDNIKLQDQFNQKKSENDQIQHDLSKALAELHHQEETLFMQQRLLIIRSELVQSLQEKEDAFKNHLAELNAEVDKKSYIVKQLSHEMSIKTQEVENLFAALNTKKLEIKRQDQIINLLEESHERNQKVRISQEEKIAHYEIENDELKRLMYGNE